MKKLLNIIIILVLILCFVLLLSGVLFQRTGTTMFGVQQLQSVPGTLSPYDNYEALNAKSNNSRAIPTLIRSKGVGNPSTQIGATPTSGNDTLPIVKGPNNLESERFIIRNANLILETENIQKLMQQITHVANLSGGYVVNSKFSQANQTDEYGAAEISIRVPAINLESSLLQLKSFATKVLYEEINGEDITDKYADLESRVKNLKASIAQLTSIMESAKQIKDILNIQKQLSDTQGQVDVLEGYINYYNQSKAYSLIRIQISMKPKLVVATPKERWQLIKVIKNSYNDLVTQLENMTYIFIEFIVYLIPLIILWCLLFSFIFLIGRKIYYIIANRQ